MTEFRITLIKEAMLAQRVTKSELARRMGLSQAALSHVLNGISKPRPELLVRIYSALAIAPTPPEPDLQVDQPPRTCHFMSLKVVLAALSARAFAKRLIESLIVALTVKFIT
ncbi:helix-turn-helix domain-containing protein [Pseudomonas sp. Ld6]|uniref:helix-turn-helix domain-containing protein n=1 Tax=Pseudomonas sp. Ld6 TaxID=649167 RepID=UPI0038699F35